MFLDDYVGDDRSVLHDSIRSEYRQVHARFGARNQLTQMPPHSGGLLETVT